MEHYKLYFATSGILTFIAIFILFSFASDLSSENLMLLSWAELPLGIMQLLVGFYFALTDRSYPVWAENGFRTYWIATVVYAMVLYILSQSFGWGDTIFLFWALGVPWGTAIYQFTIVHRLYQIKIATKVAKMNISH
tara:strand:- start:833 stop:1243 length:411 start_codon:yes stop_codon:yes gene_type:complete